MADFDALTESADFTADTTFDHTPVGTPKGVIVLIGQNGATDEQIDSVTYGGVALARPPDARGVDTNVELMVAEAWFLGSGIPTGTQTVAINETGGTTKRAWCITLTAATDTEVEDAGNTGENQDDPAITLVTGAGVETYVAALLMSGMGVVTDIAAGTGYTLLDQHDFGQQVASVEDIDTNDAGGNVVADFITTASDDVAMVAIAVKEVAGGTAFTITPSGAISPSGSLTKASSKALGGAVSPSGGIAKMAAKALVGAVSPTGTLARLTTKILGGNVSPAGSLAKRTGKLLGGSVTPSGATTFQQIKAILVGGSIAPSGALTKRTSKPLAGGVTPSGSLVKAVAKTLAGAITPTGTLTRILGKLIFLSGAITPSGTLTKATSKALGGVIAPVGTLRKLIAKILGGSITPTGQATPVGGGPVTEIEGAISVGRARRVMAEADTRRVAARAKVRVL